MTTNSNNTAATTNTTVNTTTKCDFCGGKGWLPHFQHVEGGLCFKCGGKGVVKAKPHQRGSWAAGKKFYLKSETGVVRFEIYGATGSFYGSKAGIKFCREDLPVEELRLFYKRALSKGYRLVKQK
jgi:hypothetical protein